MEYALVFWPLFFLLLVKFAQGQTSEDVVQIFSECQYGKSNFDRCIKDAFNNLRPFFKTGIPELNIKPFDPHMAPYVEQRRGDSQGLGGYRLLLSNVSEFGWTDSEVTSYATDATNNKIVYSQYFPEKSLNGFYEFKSQAIGKPFQTQGFWNLTLFRYSQTTSVTRVAGPGSLLKVRVEIDKIGDMKLHINNYLGGKPVLEKIGDFFINNMWQLGFPFIKPLINDLVSTAFTDIFNESFRYLKLDSFISFLNRSVISDKPFLIWSWLDSDDGDEG